MVHEISSKLAKEARRKIFLEGLAQDFAKLRSNKEAWGEELDERRAWDSTLRDDLREEPTPRTSS
jgi:hypothetical protein